MHKALGLLVLTVALLGGCASEGSPGARAGAGDAGDAGSPKGGGADGDPASFPAACPTAEEIGAGLGQAMTLGHDGYANGDAELFCSYEPEAGGPPVAAHRVLHADVDLADRDFREANLGDGDDPRDPDAPDLSTARDLDLGDDAFLNTYAEPAAAGGGYDIRAQARVLVDVRMCNVDGVVSVSVPSPHLTPEAEDTVVGLLSALCGLGGGGPAAPPGTEPAAGAAPLPTQCPPVEEVGDLVGEPVRLSSESVTGGGDTLQCGYDGEGSVDSLFARRFAQEDAYAAEFNFESRITTDDDPPGGPDLVRLGELDLGDRAYLNSYARDRDGGGGYEVDGRAAVVTGLQLCEAGSFTVGLAPDLDAATVDTLTYLLSQLCGL